MVREHWVQSLVESYQRLLKWYLIPLCLTLSNIRYVPRAKWSNPGKGVAIEQRAFWSPSITVTNFTYFIYIYIYIYIYAVIHRQIYVASQLFSVCLTRGILQAMSKTRLTLLQSDFFLQIYRRKRRNFYQYICYIFT